MTDDGNDVRMVALKCPNCGATLQVSPDKERAQCDHCGSSVLIVDAQKKSKGVETPAEPPVIDEKTEKRAVKIVLFGVAATVMLPVLITVITSVIIGVVLLVLAVVSFGLFK
jgi:DNA-directed RNA polymerase subunit RPC12/RpoP